jgi:hypothetical protein
MIKEKKQTFTANGIRKYLNENFKCKKTLKQFTDQDVQGYIRRGNFPKYVMGGRKIEEMNNVRGVRTFKITIDDDKDKVLKQELKK